MTVGERIALAAERSGRGPALQWLEGETVCSLTWADAHRQAAVIACGLSDLRPANRRVGVHGRDRMQWILAVFGAAVAGYGVLPLPDEEPAVLLEWCGRAGVDLVVVTDDSLLTTPEDGAVGAGTVRCVPVADLERNADVDRPTGEPSVGPDDPFLYQLTSGTTGTPKISVLSHRAVLGAASHYAHSAGADWGDTLFNPLPLHHVGGSVAGLIAALTVDGTYVLLDVPSPEDIARTIRATSPAVVGLVPTMIIDLLDSGTMTAADFHSVTSVVGGATSVDPALIDAVETSLGITFLVGYGQSEAPCLTLSSLSDSQLQRTRTIGRPLPGRDFCIAGDSGLAREGEPGELCVRGPLIMSGYLGADNDVSKTVDEHGWMRTGDLCSMREGVVTFHARLRDVVIRGGENLYPAEIETALLAHPDVAEASVFGVPDRRLGETAVAAVRLLPGSAADEAELSRFAETHLPRVKRPTAWFIVGDFPRTSTGKIRKADLARELL